LEHLADQESQGHRVKLVHLDHKDLKVFQESRVNQASQEDPGSPDLQDRQEHPDKKGKRENADQPALLDQLGSKGLRDHLETGVSWVSLVLKDWQDRWADVDHLEKWGHLESLVVKDLLDHRELLVHLA
jgi:hypothetical protein